jgi:hypothetical protein
MGLFRRKGKKHREEAAAELLREQSTTAKAQPEVARREAEAAPRAATAETRPDPDQPGWGETIGQQIGRARGERAGQE